MPGMRGSDDRSKRFYAEIWPHADGLLRAALALVGDTTDTEDLVQETLLKAYRSLDQFKAGTKVKSWLLAILRNTRIDRIRATAHQQAEVSLDEVSDVPDDRSTAALDPGANWADPNAMMQHFSDRQIIAALQRLPEDIRWTLLLVDVEGLDHADAADVMAVPVGTVKSRAHRGRAMLRKELVVAYDLGLSPKP